MSSLYGCGLCTMYGQGVELVYFPVPTTVSRDMCASTPLANLTHYNNNAVITAYAGDGYNAHAPTPTNPGVVTAVAGNHTFTSGTAYISISTVWAENRCSQTIGTPINNAILAMPSSSVLSLRYSQDHFQYFFSSSTQTGYPVSYADFNSPVPYSAWSGQAMCQGPNDVYDCGVVYDIPGAYRPQLAIPPGIRQLDPAWSDCQVWYGGLYDPPRALQPVASEALPTVPTAHGDGWGATRTAAPSSTAAASTPTATALADENGWTGDQSGSSGSSGSGHGGSGWGGSSGSSGSNRQGQGSSNGQGGGNGQGGSSGQGSSSSSSGQNSENGQGGNGGQSSSNGQSNGQGTGNDNHNGGGSGQSGWTSAGSSSSQATANAEDQGSNNHHNDGGALGVLESALSTATATVVTTVTTGVGAAVAQGINSVFDTTRTTAGGSQDYNGGNGAASASSNNHAYDDSTSSVTGHDVEQSRVSSELYSSQTGSAVLATVSETTGDAAAGTGGASSGADVAMTSTTAGGSTAAGSSTRQTGAAASSGMSTGAAASSGSSRATITSALASSLLAFGFSILWA